MNDDPKTPPGLPMPVDLPPFDMCIPPGDNRKRRVCRLCGKIIYENPRIIVAAICVWQDRFLLVRRGIEPRRGFWTFPSGYMELNETTEEGAAREVFEEAGARVKIGELIALYNLPHISQVHLVYRAEMLSEDHAPGEESEESILVAWEDIPWADLAYPTTHWAFRDYARCLGLRDFAPCGRPDGHPPQTSSETTENVSG